MRLASDCVPCTLRMMVGVAREVMPEAEVEQLLKEVLAHPALTGHDWDSPSPLLVAGLVELLVERTGQPDPLREVKRRQNQAALSALPVLREGLQAAEDPLEAAVKLSIAGNAIDAMVDSSAQAPLALLQELAGQALFGPPIADLRSRLRPARSLAYVTDNCGEIVLDRLLLEQITAESQAEITVVTHTLPILNDALEEDARAAGLHELARVIPGGSSQALPGNLVGRLGEEARRVLLDADLVIAKGVANYELLTWEGALSGRLVNLLQSKCDPVCRELGSPRGALVMAFR